MDEKGEEEVGSKSDSDVWKILWPSCPQKPQVFNFLNSKTRLLIVSASQGCYRIQ